MKLWCRHSETVPFAAALFAGALLCGFISTRGIAAGDAAGIGEGLSEAQARYARYALEHHGDAAAGEKLFRTHRDLRCANCHNVTGKEKSGPNLDGVGDKYSREELVAAR